MPEKLQMFPLIIDKWIGGTRYMSLEEKGLYLELLIYLFTEQKPIKDSAHVARIAGIDPRRSARLWPKIAEKFAVNQHGSTHLLVSKILNNSGRIKGLDVGGVGGGVPAQEKEKEYKEKNKQKKKNEYSEVFEKTWAQYPKREGYNSKTDAYKAWQARLRAGVREDELADGVSRYAAYVRAKGNEGTQFVLLGKTFFGTGNHWSASWEVNNKPPKRNGAGTAEDIAREYQQAFGKPPPAGKTTDEVRMLISQKRDKQQQWWNG